MVTESLLVVMGGYGWLWVVMSGNWVVIVVTGWYGYLLSGY